MTLTAETRFNIGDPAYFLDENHEITKGIVREIECKFDIYKNWYEDSQKSCIRIKYALRIEDIQDSQYIFEDHLFKDPNEIIAVLNDQIERGDFN
jgi:hypothetical protein